MTFVPSDRVRRPFTAALLLSLVLALGAAHAAQPTTVRIGLLNFESETSYLSRRDNVQRTMVAYLQEKIPELRIEPHYYTTAELTRAIERREVEFFMGSSGFYVTMLQKGVRDVATLISPNFPDPNQVTAGAIFVRADRKDLTDIASLEDKTVVSTHPLNFMTYQINLGEVAKAGYDPDRFFHETLFTNNRPVEVMRAVLEGRADVGFLRACMVEGISARNPEFQGKFRFINRRPGPREERLGCRYSTDAYPGWTMAVVPHTPPAITHRVALALLSMKPEETPAGYSWSLATNFEDINNLFRTLRIGPYEYLRHWTVKRIFEQFWPALLFLLGVFLTWVLHWWRVEKLVVRRTRELEASLVREREIEENARKLTGRLEALQRTRTVEQLSSIFAHDLGQPLSAMRYALRGLE
ncbi:MAG TPA: phosphate/phosphite/phosphonate ABC transporter substrate-binding protein, partial [Candidatus Sutterella merdavium]|nr:phosphate/phosphite/phosphonate ABC transporter substrate-binding protein [Candidatus Sutterella merdavium]